MHEESQHYNLERETSRGRIGVDAVSNRGETDQEGEEGIETQLQRLPHLDKWFVDIGNPSPALWENYSCLSS